MLTCSATEGTGLDAVWTQLQAHRQHLERTGQLTEQRRQQDVRWMWSTIDDRLLARFRSSMGDPATALEEQIRLGEITPTAAAEQLLGLTDDNV